MYQVNCFETAEAQAIAVSENVTAAFRDLIKRKAWSAIEAIFVDIECHADEASETGDDSGKMLASAKSKYQQAYKHLIKNGDITGEGLLVWSHKEFSMVPVQFRNRDKKTVKVAEIKYTDLKALCSDLSQAEMRQVAQFIKSLKSA